MTLEFNYKIVMINFYYNLPLRRKLVLINVLILLPVIIIGTIISINVVKHNSMRAVENEVKTFGELTASFVVADLLFNDKTAVQISLENFKNLPNVTYAAILNNDFEPIASYGFVENDLMDYFLESRTSRFEENDYLYYKSVTYRNEKLGTLFIVNDNSRLQEIINKIYIGIIGASIFAFFVLIFASTSIQRLVIQPITKLVSIIEEIVKTQNYSKRVVQNRYKDEVGLLYSDFNEMLERIDKTMVSQNFLDNVMGSLAEMVIVLDEDGTINTINEAVTRLSGYTFDDLQYQFPTILLKDFKEINEQKNQVLAYETVLQIKNHSTIEVSVSVTMFVDNEGKQRTILSIRDITKRKIAEQQLKAYYSELEQTNKDLEELSYILSHDLKAPIRGIGSLVTMMREDFKADDLSEEMIDDYFELIQKRIKRMNGLINGILEFSKVGRKEVESKPIELNSLISEIVETIVPNSFEVHVASNLPTISFNQIHAYQIFQNIISNAVKYNDKANGRIDITFKEFEDKYQFKIKDNGIGIPEKYQDKVFKVFQILASKDDVDSTGVGLAIVKKIIKKAKGSIWIDSNFDVGVAFIFELPK